MTDWPWRSILAAIGAFADVAVAVGVGVATWIAWRELVLGKKPMIVLGDWTVNYKDPVLSASAVLREVTGIPTAVRRMRSHVSRTGATQDTADQGFCPLLGSDILLYRDAITRTCSFSVEISESDLSRVQLAMGVVIRYRLSSEGGRIYEDWQASHMVRLVSAEDREYAFEVENLSPCKLGHGRLPGKWDETKAQMQCSGRP